MKILVDMNLSPRWVGTFASAGLVAVHWSSIGAANAHDSEIMAFAAANDYVVPTHDLDFGAILAATRGEKPSVAQIRADDVSPEAIGQHVVAALHQMEQSLLSGALLTIEPARVRVSLLPLQASGGDAGG